MTPHNDPRRVLVVGFGAAGLASATALRAAGFAGNIDIVADEAELPYDRPPLSKTYLAGAMARERLDLASPDAIAQLGAALHLGVRATRLHLAERVVESDTRDDFPFDDLIIATGANPRRLRFPGSQAAHVLRSHDDSLALRRAASLGDSLVVLGSGFIGLEVASTVRSLGLKVTVVDPDPAPMETRLGSVMAGRLISLHRQRGVDVRLGTRVTAIDWSSTIGDKAGKGRAYLSDGTECEVDLTLSAVGTTPSCDWLSDSGLEIDNGVVCDAYCRAAPGVWAVGDVARWAHPGAKAPIRIEHRTNAAEQGRAVARNILGERQPFAPIPFFWTDQFDAKIQVAGFHEASAREVILHDGPLKGSLVVGFEQSGRLQGVAGWNAAREMLQFRRQLSELMTRQLVES